MAYYQALGDNRYQPTMHVQGAWADDEQHMALMGGILTHAIERHEPRPELQLARLSFDILGKLPLEETTVVVKTVRPGRTIELVEAVATVGGRDVCRARAWRLAVHDSSAAAGNLRERLLPKDQMVPGLATGRWPGGFIRTLTILDAPTNRPGAGQSWLHSPILLVDGEEATPTAEFVKLVDTMNGITVWQHPTEWMFPNVDLTIHLLRTPIYDGWVGFDNHVTFGPDGLGITSTVLHDDQGPVGQAVQSLTVRALG